MIDNVEHKLCALVKKRIKKNNKILKETESNLMKIYMNTVYDDIDSELKMIQSIHLRYARYVFEQT